MTNMGMCMAHVHPCKPRMRPAKEQRSLRLRPPGLCPSRRVTNSLVETERTLLLQKQAVSNLRS